ncbi:MAG: antitoxin [Verrucomicrobiota bacterium]|jgi:hypothetical protein
MIKTQVQIPDHLYQEAKRIAAEYEMSFAEVVRRGLERLAPAYPPKRPLTDWEPPKPRRLGCRPLTAAQLRDIARGEDELPAWLARPKGKKT